MKKYTLITSFIFVFVLGGAFLSFSKNAEAVTDGGGSFTTGQQYIAAWTPVFDATGYIVRLYEGSNTKCHFQKN